MTAAVVLHLMASGSLSAQGNRRDLLLTRASAYVQGFINRFVNVVAEEQYLQEIVDPRRTRHLRSDFLLVKPQASSAWVTFRDVYEVDGKAVRDRDDRLAKLFLEPSDASFTRRVREITDAGARYNLINYGTLNNPLLAISFLQPMYRDRFRFLPGTNDKKVGPDVWTLQFIEFRRPTILKGNGNSDVEARGNYWIEEGTGRIVKSELQVGPTGINATRITTTFGLDDRLQIYVPVEMRESYPDASTGTATYSRFRRFDVTTEETIRAQ